MLDGIVSRRPSINEPITGGTGQISGGFTHAAEVNKLVTVLRYGALPHAIEEVSFSKISPTLGLELPAAEPPRRRHRHRCSSSCSCSSTTDCPA